MKRLILLTLLAGSAPHKLSSEINSEIPLGIEAVTGIRSEYVHRGFTLSEDSVLDFQLETEIALNDYTFLNVGGWYATGTGDGDFEESAFLTKLSFQKSDEFTIGLSATYRGYTNSFFESGVDLGIYGSWQLNKDFGINSGIHYDFGADALYANLEANWSHALSDDAFISLKTGVSYVNDYYGRDGLNDFYARLSFTYHISEAVSVTPFIGTSVLIDDDSNTAGVLNDDNFHGGLWFVVRF